MARPPLGARRTSVALLVVCLLASARVWAQQPDPRVLANPLVKQTLKVDPSTWQANAVLSPEVRAKVDATLARQRALKAARAGQEVKVGSLLRAYQRTAAAAEPTPAGRVRAMRSRLPILGVEPDGTVRARIHLRGGPDAEAAIRALGVRIARVSADGRVLYAALSAADIDRVAAQAVVAKISPIVGAKVNAGSVLSEGVAALRADRVQAQLRVTGKKVRIGVISDGMESIAAPTATGDIPATGAGLPKVELCPLNDNSGDEGTAMLEIVHDMAPSAALAFCPAFGDTGQQGLADAVTWLATQAFGGKGADVIVDDVGYLTEPFFQDGVIAQAVDAAVAHGVSYFSSAGNSADAHYEHAYADIVPGDDSFPFDTHDFGSVAGLGPDIGWDGLVAGNGNFFAAFMQWNDPFGGSANDYDIYLFDADGDLAGDPLSDFPIGGSGCRRAGRQRRSDGGRVRGQRVPWPDAGRHDQRVLHGHRLLLRRAERTAGRPGVQRLLRSRPGEEHRGGQHLRPRRQPRRDGRRRHRRGREHRRHAQPGPRRHRGVQLARSVADSLLHAGRRRRAGGAAQAEHDRDRRHLGRPASTSSRRSSGPRRWRRTRRRLRRCSRTSIPASVRPASPASCARRRSIAARQASIRRGASAWSTPSPRPGAPARSATVPLFWVCLPTKKDIEPALPEFLIPAALALGLEFGRCN